MTPGEGDDGENFQAVRRRTARQSVPDQAFDVWLRKDLKARFGAVQHEEIPAELLALIQRPQSQQD